MKPKPASKATLQLVVSVTARARSGLGSHSNTLWDTSPLRPPRRTRTVPGYTQNPGRREAHTVSKYTVPFRSCCDQPFPFSLLPVNTFVTMVRYVVVAGCSAGEAARIYALLVLLVLVGLSPARARVSTVLGEISHLDELKLTKRSSARFLKAGGIIDGSDLEEIFQAIPHLRGGPRRPPRRRKLKTCGENWCFGSCPSGFWTTFGGCGGARRLRDVGRYAACPQGVWRSKRGIGCCDGGPIQEGADEGINDYCTTCTPCGPNKYQDLGG